MVESPKMKRDRKADLIAELEWSRIELAQSVRAVHADLDIPARFKESVVHRKTIWLGGAALAGWVLSRLPGRRKKSPPSAAALPAPSGAPGWVKEVGQTGFWLAILNALFNLLKPLLTTFATHKINQLASRSDFGSHGKERRFF